jgi:hypothetical protein
MYQIEADIRTVLRFNGREGGHPEEETGPVVRVQIFLVGDVDYGRAELLHDIDKVAE